MAHMSHLFRNPGPDYRCFKQNLKKERVIAQAVAVYIIRSLWNTLQYTVREPSVPARLP